MSEEILTEEAENQGVSNFYYSIADYNILLESGIKTEIIEKRDVFPIPHTPSWCRGMISLRGKLIPVANLHQLFPGSDASNSQWLLVMEIAPYPQLAILIDHLPKQQVLGNQLRQTVENGDLPAWFESSISINENALYHVNHKQLFEQLIQENEASRLQLQDPQPTPNQDTSGHNA